MTLHFDPTRTRYRFETYDKVTINGIDFRPVSESEEGYIFVRVDKTGVAEAFPHGVLSRRVADGDIVHERGAFLPEGVRRSLVNSAADIDLLATLPDAARERLLIRDAFVQAYYDLERQGRVKRTYDSVDRVMVKLQTLAKEYTDTRNGKAARKYVGGYETMPKAPSSKTLLEWVRGYERENLVGLGDHRAKGGNRTSRFMPEERIILMEEVRKYATPERPTQAMIFRNVQAAFEVANAERAKEGLSPLAVPSRETVRRSILKLDPFHVDIGRMGLEAARRKHAPVGQGLQLTRPLERVEMDEWEVDLITIMSDTGLLAHLDDEELRSLGFLDSKGKPRKTFRMWLSVAICAASRCIVGMRLSTTPTAANAVKTLEMVVRDKGQWADAVDALSSWDMHGTPETIVTDGGSSYKSLDFRGACADLGITAERAPGGLPQLRGTVERVFRTIGDTLIPRLTGRTFSNVVARGDYDSEGRAALTIDDLTFALIRWVVDIYHNTPHAGLAAQTPLNRWRELNHVWGVTPIPAMRRRRLVFGTATECTVQNDGITVLGISYQTEQLARWAIHARNKKVEVRWYSEDLGAIEVKLDGEWHQVDAALAGFAGVKAQTWLAAARRLRAARRKEAEMALPIVLQAIREIEAMNSDAKAAASILTEDWSEDRLAYQEERLFTGFNVVASSTNAPAQRDEIGLVIPTDVHRDPDSSALPPTSSESASGEVISGPGELGPSASTTRSGSTGGYSIEED
ncbi:putative transposase [Rhodovulum sp. ES.010]|uniref:DDE-type integrase/transposase/recombinase n=1 Tax=Rhodovulum sp. ES.010 TaxID=1882821 RepID=UPI000926DB75|nr:DDE-type integrase/transposase/recombinase [Rhodovulum sp. ES.010]SIO39444.1 putative transposase [Rhodovulum sp. ES.010]